MNKELEALERLAMPDELHISECKKAGIGLTEDYEVVKQALLELKFIKEANHSEALEAFGRITLHTEYDNDSYYDGLHFEDDCKLVDKALEFLEAIENANPSEALKCLEDLYCEPVDYRSNDRVKDYETIKNYILNAQKELKALEIIKEKECDIRWFKYCIKENLKVETYNNGLPEYYEKLTQEEFNLLKEVLE